MQDTKGKTFLKHISFEEIDLYWDVKRLSYKSNFWSSFKMEKLWNIINPISDKIKKDEYDWVRKVVSKIKFNNWELFLRDENKTWMDVYITYPWNLLISNINFHQWALAINNIWEEIVCSTHYQPYEINRNLINEDYLVLVLRTHSFKDYVVNQKSNWIKTESKFNFIKDLEIPLPSLSEQNRIVEAYQKNISDAELAQKKSERLEWDIESYLMEELGIEIAEQEQKKSMNFISLESLNRWDVRFLLWNLPSIKSRFPIKKFSYAIEEFNKWKGGESIRINSFNFPRQPFKYIWMEHIEKETGNVLELVDVNWKDIKSQTVRIPKWYIIFWKLRPYLNKYWINYTEYENIICSSEFLVFDTREDINKEYFKYCLSSSFIQHQITDKTSWARMPRINEDIFMNLQFPLPPIEIQEKIVDHIWAMKDEIWELKQSAEELRESAGRKFEEEIFSS